MTQSIDLLDQIIEMAQVQAKDLDAYNLMRHKAMKTIGINPVVYNLQQLRELILIESKHDNNRPS